MQLKPRMVEIMQPATSELAISSKDSWSSVIFASSVVWPLIASYLLPCLVHKCSLLIGQTIHHEVDVTLEMCYFPVYYVTFVFS